MRFLNCAAKFGAAFVLAVAFSAPVLAAPMDLMSMGMHHMDAMHDHGHRPPMRVEHHPRMPHKGMHWRDGSLTWRHNTWAWVPGLWVR